MLKEEGTQGEGISHRGGRGEHANEEERHTEELELGRVVSKGGLLSSYSWPVLSTFLSL